MTENQIPSAKEKAEQMVAEFAQIPQENTLMWHLSYEIAKKCALVAIKEVLRAAIFGKQDIYDFYLDVQIELEKL